MDNGDKWERGAWEKGDGMERGAWEKGGQQGWKKGSTVEAVWGANAFGVADKESHSNSSNNMTGHVGGSSGQSSTGAADSSDRSSGSWQEALLRSVQK